MKVERKASKQELQPSSHRHQHSSQPNSNPKCVNCKIVPKRQRNPSQPAVKKQAINPKSRQSKVKQLNSTHSKSLHDAWQDSFDEESQEKKSREMKRQSNSYCKFLHEKSQQEESTVHDYFFEQKYKESQNQLLQQALLYIQPLLNSTKSKLFENQCKLDSLQAELKKLRNQNKMLQEKTNQLEADNQESSKKCLRYKQLARSMKSSLTQTQSQLENMKKVTSQEIKALSQSVSMMEKLVKQRSIQYVTNLKTIHSFLVKIQRMMVPTDQNYHFNVKVLHDLTDLCSQLTQMTLEEESSLQESLNSNNQQNLQYKSNRNEDLEFVFSQTTTNEFNTGYSQKTKEGYDSRQVAEDYEKLKYESAYLRKQNAMLKAKNEEISFLQQDENKGQYDTRQSERTRQQNLSVADLIQLDSVCKVNQKLEQKNQYLEEQIIMMKIQMEDLIRQTQELQQSREKQAIEEESIEESRVEEVDKTRKRIPVPQTRQIEQKTQKLYLEQLGKQQQSPSEDQSDLCEKESTVPFPFQRTFDNTNAPSSTRKYMRPSVSTSHIDSSNKGGQSKLTSVTNSRRKNVFRRNQYMDQSDKENLTSARDLSGYQPKQHQLINVFNYEEGTRNFSKPSFANTLTSPLGNGTSLLDRLNRQQQKSSSRDKINTFRQKPMSVGSTSTLIINEKAKALKDEITTLDEEIVQLQNNLKKAIKRKDSRGKV